MLTMARKKRSEEIYKPTSLEGLYTYHHYSSLSSVGAAKATA